jgi:hypothetical protein
VLGHALAYLIAIPDPHERAFALQRAGHAYLPALDQVALMLAIAGVVAVVVRAFARRPGGATERFGRLATLLVVVQTSAFAGQEVLERLVSGAPLGDLSHDRILVTGMIVQILATPGSERCSPNPSPSGGRRRSCSRRRAASERHPPPESPPRCSRARPSGRARTRLEVRPCRNDRAASSSPPQPP